MEKYKIPEYYFDKTLTEEEKCKKDWEMIADDFLLPTEANRIEK